MNGAIYESTMNVFFKLNYAKIYDAVLATPLGVARRGRRRDDLALIRGAIYSVAFFDDDARDGAVRVVVGAPRRARGLLIGSAFAAFGMPPRRSCGAGRTSSLSRSLTLPLFLFSATFYPLDDYPHAIQGSLQITPLYHGVDLMR